MESLETAQQLRETAGAVTGVAPKITAQVLPRAEATALLVAATGAGLAAAGEVVVLTLTGGEFTAPVQLTLNFDAAKVAAGKVPGVFVYNERTGRWIYLAGQVGNGVITVTVDRFSKFAVFAMAPVPSLTDIATHWAANNIRTLAGMRVLAGYPDATFKPSANITRAEFVAMLVRALGLAHREAAAGRFKDGAGFGWARGAIGAAVEAGLVRGFPDGTFRPATKATRAEMAAMLYRLVAQR